MKKFDDLSSDEKEKAVKFYTDKIIQNSIEVGCFPEQLDEFQDVLETAIDEAEKLQTPWFIGEILSERIDENTILKDKMLHVATAMAKMSLYKEKNEMVVHDL